MIEYRKKYNILRKFIIFATYRRNYLNCLPPIGNNDRYDQASSLHDPLEIARTIQDSHSRSPVRSLTDVDWNDWTPRRRTLQHLLSRIRTLSCRYFSKWYIYVGVAETTRYIKKIYSNLFNKFTFAFSSRILSMGYLLAKIDDIVVDIVSNIIRPSEYMNILGWAP